MDSNPTNTDVEAHTRANSSHKPTQVKTTNPRLVIQPPTATCNTTLHCKAKPYYAMWHHTIQHHVMRFHTVIYHDMQSCDSPWRNMPQYTIICYTTPWCTKTIKTRLAIRTHHDMQLHTVLRYAIPCHPKPFYTMRPKPSILGHVTPYHTMSCHADPHCNILWHAMLC